MELEQITINNQKSTILGYLKHSKGIINEQTVKSFLDSKDSQTWKSNQSKALRRYLRDFLKLGRWIEEFKITKQKPKAKKENLPNNQQLTEFCVLLPYQIQIIFLMMFNSGLRIGEILSLHHKDVNFDTNLIDASNIHRGDTKFSWYSFITQQTSEFLDSYIMSEAFQFKEGDENNTNLFNISARSVQQEFKNTSESLGFSLNPHLLRTIFAERCREAGIEKEYIDAFCGRTPKGMLAQHYTNYSPESLRKQYEKVEHYLILPFS